MSYGDLQGAAKRYIIGISDASTLYLLWFRIECAICDFNELII